jgi:hypothetical protein
MMRQRSTRASAKRVALDPRSTSATTSAIGASIGGAWDGSK